MGYFSELDIEMDAVIEAVEVNYNFEDVIKRGEKSALSFYFEDTEGLTEITIYVEAPTPTKAFLEAKKNMFRENGWENIPSLDDGVQLVAVFKGHLSDFRSLVRNAEKYIL